LAMLFCFDTSWEWEFFMAQPGLLWAAILAYINCGCEHGKKQPRNGTAKAGHTRGNKQNKPRLLKVDNGMWQYLKWERAYKMFHCISLVKCWNCEKTSKPQKLKMKIDTNWHLVDNKFHQMNPFYGNEYMKLVN
jgi:hypothetical protein